MMILLFVLGFILFVTGIIVVALADGDGFLVTVGEILSCIGGYIVGLGLVQAFTQ